MVDLSRTTASYLGAEESRIWFTHDATETGAPCLVTLTGDDWSPIRTNAVAGVYADEIQRHDIGGESGTENWPGELLIHYCPDALEEALRELYTSAPAPIPASFTLAATDENGTERELEFDGIVLTAPVTHETRRFIGRTYEAVKVSWISVE